MSPSSPPGPFTRVGLLMRCPDRGSGMSTWPTCPATKGFMMPIRTVCLDDDALAAMFPAAVEPRPARRTNNRLQVYTYRFRAYLMGTIVQLIQPNDSDQLLD